ncbi:GNAT family N-acetyltransferase [Cryptosporangium sp. NPDC048952]|uniref:GNAT family N-acetyltransferase n=1 Tax=Cryptosporangium sp. NPDC048952 TaxID=3363961 RepID=UPI00371621A6
MIFRPAVEAELARVLPLVVADPACALTADTYRARLADGEYRLDHTWIAEDASTVLAVAIWWGDTRPEALDAVFVHASVHDPAALAGDLLAAAGEQADFHLLLPRDWRNQPDVAAAVAWRREAAGRAGLVASLERLRYEWTPGVGLPAPSGRLSFRAEPDDEVFVDLFRQVLAGSLDTTSGREAARVGAAAQARNDVAFYRDAMLGDRSWWRIGEAPDGKVIGFGVPSRNRAFPVVGYLGVLPEHRGHRYADDILGEITRILASETAPKRIRADTDSTNTPMAAAFERAGYRNYACRLVLSAPGPRR